MWTGGTQVLVLHSSEWTFGVSLESPETSAPLFGPRLSLLLQEVLVVVHLLWDGAESV